MLKILLLVVGIGSAPKEDYSSVQRFNDSLLIYNSYQGQVKLLTALKETDRPMWYSREAYIDSLTACAKLRLKKYNKLSYEPTGLFERPGFGIALQYPCPSTIRHQTPEAYIKSGTPTNRYIVYDKQTHFLTGSDGKAIPYIKRLIFDKGRLLYIEKLNPVTLELLTTFSDKDKDEPKVKSVAHIQETPE